MISLALALTLALAQPAGPQLGAQGFCVRLSGGSTHFYPASDRTILVSAGLRAYRITTSPSSLLADRNATIVTRYVGSGVVCSPLELGLEVVSPSGRAGLIVQSVTRLSAAEAKSLRAGGPSYRKLGL